MIVLSLQSTLPAAEKAHKDISAFSGHHRAIHQRQESNTEPMMVKYRPEIRLQQLNHPLMVDIDLILVNTEQNRFIKLGRYAFNQTMEHFNYYYYYYLKRITIFITNKLNTYKLRIMCIMGLDKTLPGFQPG